MSYNQTNDDRGSGLTYEDLPKTELHGVSAEERHPDVLSEWIMRIIAEPFDRYTDDREGTHMTVLVGRVPEVQQWIKLVFIGDPETGLFHTAYIDRRLSRRYGGRPWQRN